MATTEPGLITSPAYPEPYPDNVDSCATLIYTNESNAIQLSFDVFNVEDNSECGYDYLEVCTIYLMYPVEYLLGRTLRKIGVKQKFYSESSS